MSTVILRRAITTTNRTTLLLTEREKTKTEIFRRAMNEVHNMCNNKISS